MNPAEEHLRSVLARIPYARFLGVEVELHGDEMTAILPFSQKLIGNPLLPAIHGGVIGAFMEMTALAQLSVDAGGRQPKPIDVTVQFLRSGKPLDTYARATVKRAGRRIASVSVEAWQEARLNPIASLQGHFLVAAEAPSVGSADSSPDGSRESARRSGP